MVEINLCFFQEYFILEPIPNVSYLVKVFVNIFEGQTRIAMPWNIFLHTSGVKVWNFYWLIILKMYGIKWTLNSSQKFTSEIYNTLSIIFPLRHSGLKIWVYFRNGNLEKLLILQEMELSSPSSKNKNIHPEKIYSNIKKTFYIFSKESFSYILGNGNPRKNPLYFRKQNFSYIPGKEYSQSSHSRTFL